MCFDTPRPQPQSIDETNERLPVDEPALPTIAPEITAVIHDAAIVGDRIVGKSFDHSRFANGEVIRTSPIVATFLVHVTRSGSYYLVEDNRAKPSPIEFRPGRRAIADNPQA